MPRHRHATLSAAGTLAALATACLLATGAQAAPAASSLPRLTQPLAGPGWTLSNGEGVKLDVSVPVMALQAMEDAGLVDDPLWR